MAKKKRISCKERHRRRWRKGGGRFKKVGLDPKSFLDEEQIMMVLTYARNKAAGGGFRAAVTLMLLESYFYTGLRAIELLGLCLLDLPGYNGQKAMIRVPGDFGKKKERIVLVSPKIVVKWEKYILRFHKPALKAIASGDKDRKLKALRTPLFLNERGKGMEYHNVWQRLRTVKENTGVELRPHICRHSYATQLLKRSGDIGLVQDQLGHSSPATTRIYAKTLKASSIQHLARLDFG